MGTNTEGEMLLCSGTFIGREGQGAGSTEPGVEGIRLVRGRSRSQRIPVLSPLWLASS